MDTSRGLAWKMRSWGNYESPDLRSAEATAIPNPSFSPTLPTYDACDHCSVSSSHVVSLIARGRRKRRNFFPRNDFSCRGMNQSSSLCVSFEKKGIESESNFYSSHRILYGSIEIESLRQKMPCRVKRKDARKPGIKEMRTSLCGDRQ